MLLSLFALMSLAVVGAGISVPSRSRLPKGYVCYRTPKTLTIDGNLDKPEWKAVAWTEYFEDIEGDVRPKPRFRTRAKMLWDDTYFYIAAELEEPNIWATLTEHDSVIFQDNDFEVFIDPDGDNHQYYEFEINALNTTWDLRLVKPYRDGGPALNEWEIPGMKSAIKVNGTLNNPTDTDKSWTVELAFPWEVLKEYANRPSPPLHGDQWRINFSRVEWDVEVVDGKTIKVPNRPEHNWVWSPQGAIDMHRPERWGYVQFSTAEPGKSRFVRDAAEPVRDRLMQVYWAQREYHGKHGRWAEKATELTLPGVEGSTKMGDITLKLTQAGYTATIPFARTKQKQETWHISQDSRIWKES